MFRSQRLALKYLAAAMTLFGIMVVAGLLASIYYVHDGLLLEQTPTSALPRCCTSTP